MEAIASTSAALPSRWRQAIYVGLAFVFSLVTAVACYLAAGASLGLFFGPVLLMPFLAPALITGQRAVRWRLAVCAALTLGTFLVWLFLASLPAMDLLRAGGVLLAFVVAMAGCASVLESIGLGPTFSAAFTSLLAIAWLTWPVWLSHWLSGPHVDRTVYLLTFAHPLITLNGALYPRFDIWDRYTLTYQQLTTLNQDLIYTLPRSVGWMMALHLLPGLIGLGIPLLLRRRLRKSRLNAPVE